MTHPDELLAEYEDGALAVGERAVLEGHLARCARCRDQVELARAARAALVGVPDAVAPSAIGDRAIGAARSPRKAPAWYRWGGVAAGVAAAIVVGALVLPKVGTGEDREAAGALPAAAPSTSGSLVQPATSIESQDAEYDAKGVEQLAGTYAGKGFGLATTDRAAAPAQETTGKAPAFEAASTCLDRAASGAEGELIRLIQARYEGTSAYFGVYLTGPAAGRPANGVRVLVVPINACSHILTSTWRKL
jgi:Putative zinc-finger